MYNVRRRKMPKKNIYTCPACKHIFDDYDVYKVDDDCQAISQKQNSNEFNKNNYHPQNT